MSTHEKLINKLLFKQKGFTYNEMATLLKGYGYIEEERGRTSGSAVMFYHRKTKDKILFHKPHPKKELKKYILRMIIEKLKMNNML